MNFNYVRKRAARHFYPENCIQAIEKYIADNSPNNNTARRYFGAIVPHAGWIYSGGIAARTIRILADNIAPQSVIVLGADHAGVAQHSVLTIGDWETPLGNISINSELGNHIIDQSSDLIIDDIQPHTREHSIEVIAPMIKYFFPNISIVPIIVRPDISSIEVGKIIASSIDNEQNIIVIASTDLTHYGLSYGFSPAGHGKAGLSWMHDNDSKMIDVILTGTGNEILEEADRHRNACGAGAIAALKQIVGSTGRGNGRLIEYSTSYGNNDPTDFDLGVGYAGIVF
ncbi:MAG: AmmeMemoRadiSam system protein B [Candidatus Marinimicrobia bacterium]|nr:AmmeMemoRadiSam system protein B [Candidatus Neomarinimicrobiota bacterium]